MSRTARSRLALALGLLTAAVALAQLLVPSAIGLADNGDFFRLTCQLHLQADVAPQASARFVVWVPHWRPEAPGAPPCVGLASSQLPLLRLAQALSPGAGLDLRVVGALQAVLLGLLVGLVVLGLPGGPRLRATCGVLLAVVLLDTGRLVYLASAYSEPVSLLGLLLLLGTALGAFRRPPGALPDLAVCLSAVPLVLAKPQDAPVAAVVAAVVLARHAVRLVRRRRERRGGVTHLVRLAAGLVLAVGLLAVADASLRAVPPELREPNTYNVVFFEVLAHSPDPQQDARDLGIDPELVRWKGTGYFTTPNAASDPAFAGFYGTVGTRTVVAFYAAHPGRSLSLFARAARDSSTVLPDYLGTYPAAAHRPDYAQACRGCPVTLLGEALRPAAPVLLPLLWLGAAGAALALLVRRRAGRDPGDVALATTTLLLTGSTVVLFAVAVLGSGNYELVKHLFLASVGSTLLLPLGLAVAVRLRAAGRSPRPAERQLTAPVPSR